MNASLSSRLAVIAAAATTILALSGCATGATAASSPTASGPPAQSKTEACAALQDSMTTSAKDLQSSLATVGTDPTAAIAKLQSLSDSFDSGLKKVSEPTVKKVGQKADGSLKEMLKEMKAIIADPAHADVTKFQTTVIGMETDFVAISKICK